jgi:hypothetical protein
MQSVERWFGLYTYNMYVYKEKEIVTTRAYYIQPVAINVIRLPSIFFSLDLYIILCIVLWDDDEDGWAPRAPPNEPFQVLS